MPPDIATLGQVYTPRPIVERMIALKRNNGRVLEPSAGCGAFMAKLGAHAIGIEIAPPPSLHNKRIIKGDFFHYPTKNKFDTIIGNPPYVRFQDIPFATRALLPTKCFDKRSNLYLFFIEKCLRHLNPGGELIFITPRTFMKATSARHLNRLLYDEGSFTHFEEMGDAKIFRGVSPNCVIWRWEKGRKSRSIQNGHRFHYKNGQLWFGAAEKNMLGDYFSVKVGAVSGADRIFTHAAHGCTEFVCSTTAITGKTRRMIYNRPDDYLLQHKALLLNRRIRKFNESNWWQWGRGYFKDDSPRIYVNAKTRNAKPFYIHPAKAWDGSMLALFPKQKINLADAVQKLNAMDWEKLGFVCDGRKIFSQRALENAPIAL